MQNTGIPALHQLAQYFNNPALGGGNQGIGLNIPQNGAQLPSVPNAGVGGGLPGFDSLTSQLAQPQLQPQGAPQGGTGLSGFGKLGVGAQIGSSLLSGYLGLKGLGIAEDQLAFDKSTFATNHANQVSTTNRQLEDRQSARVAANPNAESVASYLKRNRVA